ncbi:MAG: acetolactate synthase small subunit [Clostridiales bacterium]|jgi:acetolactate synthase-1/3 small subunit|nr:acetolactate synthase small subunit [Clostridiales bacterium]
MSTRTAHILTLMVDNEFGVLTRITAQIRREGWNIKSLAVAESMDPHISRITVVLECFDTTLPNVTHRLSKLACVRSVSAFSEELCICRELAVARIEGMDDKAKAVIETFGAQIIKTDNNAAMVALSETPQALDEFVLAMEGIGHVNIARTGPITLEK